MPALCCVVSKPQSHRHLVSIISAAPSTMGLFEQGGSLMPSFYSDEYKTSLNTLWASDCLSIDCVCLLSACHELNDAFLHCPIYYSIVLM